MHTALRRSLVIVAVALALAAFGTFYATIEPDEKAEASAPPAGIVGRTPPAVVQQDSVTDAFAVVAPAVMPAAAVLLLAIALRRRLA